VPEATTVVHVDGKALRERRIAADLSTEQLAVDAGLPREQVQALEDGWGPIDPRTARRLIETLVCHFNDLFVVVEEVEG
jgi:predicted transcriptional regulator